MVHEGRDGQPLETASRSKFCPVAPSCSSFPPPLSIASSMPTAWLHSPSLASLCLCIPPSLLPLLPTARGRIYLHCGPSCCLPVCFSPSYIVLHSLDLSCCHKSPFRILPYPFPHPHHNPFSLRLWAVSVIHPKGFNSKGFNPKGFNLNRLQPQKA